MTIKLQFTHLEILSNERGQFMACGSPWEEENRIDFGEGTRIDRDRRCRDQVSRGGNEGCRQRIRDRS